MSEIDGEIEDRDFAEFDEGAASFYRRHGYVVLRPSFSRSECQAAISSWEGVKRRFAEQMGMDPARYDAEIGQWRDIWRHEPTFAALLADARLWGTARAALGTSAVRLLHDHLIAKSSSGHNGTVPWHQDATFWPVDCSGLSCWMPLVDVGPTEGCLEVIDGSHAWGPEAPVDFIASPRERFPASARVVKLPAAAGAQVVLDGLTWHRSSPNTGAGTRPAYISLWLPPDARYTPEVASWHPVNEHVRAAPGERLDDDWFPVFGSETFTDGGRPAFEWVPPRMDAPLTMFRASTIISTQVAALLGRAPKNLAILLRAEADRRRVLERALEAGLMSAEQTEQLAAVIDKLWISAEAYRLHRARNIFNAAYTAWWELVGRAAWSASEGDVEAR